MRYTVLLVAALGAAVAAQSVDVKGSTAADYQRAERILSPNTTPLLLHDAVAANWLDPSRFWYRVRTESGLQAALVDAARGVKGPCDLPACAQPPSEPPSPPRTSGSKGEPGVAAPDGSRSVFIRDWNLWVRDIETGRERALTTDGVADFGYATDNAGWTHSRRANVLWSPDGKKVATFQQDQRQTGEMYVVDTRVGHPRLEAWKYPLAGDATITTIQRVIIDVATPRVIRLRMPPDQHRSTVCDDVQCRGEMDMQWVGGSDSLAFVSTSRDHKRATLRVAEASAGSVRDLLDEKVDTFFEGGIDHINWRVLPRSNEVLWWSERSDWGHLYLYDLTTGALKHPVTTGPGNVAQVLRVDERDRSILFIGMGMGMEPERDPYFHHLYRVGIDAGVRTLLTPEDADHDVQLSPGGRFFVDTYSTPDTPPVSVLRDSRGGVVLPLERADLSKVLATGWTPPMRFTVKARDGKTDLYGLLYRPTAFDPSRKYPIINHVYPGPQRGSVGSRAFWASGGRGDPRALAELGFIVVEVDGLGTPGRNKAFHAASYGNLADNTIPDQLAAMRELATRFSWIDLVRAGIYGHSGGGYATATAMFDYPDFFKVGISEAGNHDNRIYEDDWAEKWQGLEVKAADGSSNYDLQANQLKVDRLKGKLLLAHGSMDDNVPMNNTLVLVDALISANKDFDLLILPNRRHGFGNEPYMIRRRWDYFVRHLLETEPPTP